MKKIVQMLGLVSASALLVIGINQGINKIIGNDEKEVVMKAQQEKVASVETSYSSEESLLLSKERTDPLPDVSVDDTNLILVGPENPLKNEIDENNLATIPDTEQRLEKTALKAYEELASAAKKANFELVVISAYRSISYQEEIFSSRVADLVASGLSENAATEEIKKTSTEPGFSEHHTGLALDVVDENWSNNYKNEVLEEAFGTTDAGIWLSENVAQYGFIIRYPQGKEAVTKITYEPWHIRYVGKENAQYIVSHQLTLEEYLELLKEKDE